MINELEGVEIVEGITRPTTKKVAWENKFSLIRLNRRLILDETDEQREQRIITKWRESRARHLSNKLQREIPKKVEETKRDKL